MYLLNLYFDLLKLLLLLILYFIEKRKSQHRESLRGLTRAANKCYYKKAISKLTKDQFVSKNISTLAVF